MNCHSAVTVSWWHVLTEENFKEKRGVDTCIKYSYSMAWAIDVANKKFRRIRPYSLTGIHHTDASRWNIGTLNKTKMQNQYLHRSAHNYILVVRRSLTSSTRVFCFWEPYSRSRVTASTTETAPGGVELVFRTWQAPACPNRLWPNILSWTVVLRECQSRNCH